MLLEFLLVALIALVGSVSCFIQGRVVNGIGTDVTKYPFVVSLRSDGGSHICGGSIIDQRWILTAAHCVYGSSASQLSVQYGTTEISKNGANIVNVNRIVMHDRYDKIKIFNDIALLELKDSLVYNYKTIAPVKLPKANFEVPQTKMGASGVLIGWGAKSTSGSSESTLQKTNLIIYSDKYCNLKHGSQITNNEMCAGVDEGSKGSCHGDSGSPFLYDGGVQVGIVSWIVRPCGSAFTPGVYTKVSHYINWIEENKK